MDTIGTVSSVIAALATIITLIFTVRNSKGNIRKRIKKRERELRDIDTQIVRMYGLDRGRNHPITTLDRIKEKIQSEIDDLYNRL